jgi:DNA gyrase subunit B
MSAEALEQLAREQLLSEAVISRLSRRMDPVVLKCLETGVVLDLSSRESAERTAREIQARLEGDGVLVGTAYDDATEAYELRIRRRVHGVERLTVLDRDFAEGGDHAQLVRTSTLLEGLLGTGAYVVRGESRRPVSSFQAALDWLLAEAQRGVSIQRYKGLGEMNPDQLWETTMDPGTRRLLRAQIEDTIAADEIFSTLMGDVVEPRRAFIESNALGVRNLDV